MIFRENLFKDKTVIITGGGTGLGKSMAAGLAALGANIAICGRRLDVLEATANEITQNTGAAVLTHACDVRKFDEVENFIAAVAKRFGTIDALINNAAGNFVSPTEALSANAFDAVVRIVLHGTFHATQAAGHHWMTTGTSGRILNICTTYAWTGSAFVVPSACAKAGVLAMTRSLAVEWAKYGIRVNAVAPGPFPTEQAWANLMPEGFEEKMLARNPLHRVGRHEELVDLVRYLLSDSADYINGACFTIDGGEWLQGAGEFNGLTDLKPEDWLALKVRAAKK